MGQRDLAGSAQLELVSGVAHLRPEDAMFEAMLRGWRAQQVARGLRPETVEGREQLVCRFLQAANEYPWNWGPAHAEELTLSLAGLMLDLVATRHGHAALGDQETSPWLFPGGQPGRPISASRITERLRQLGIHAGPARSTALFQLATELPAAVIARMLGVHIKVAVEWQRISSGDWARYAADYSRQDTDTR